MRCHYSIAVYCPDDMILWCHAAYELRLDFRATSVRRGVEGHTGKG